jgi:cysteine synthase A
MDIRDGFVESIGRTPLIRLRRVSEETGCEIYGKAEFLNPGQSVKDRAAMGIILDAEAKGSLRPGGVIVEGTAGNTGIGLALVSRARGYRTVIVIPETQSQEKKDMLRLCGADLREVPAVPYKDPNNYVHVAARLADQLAEIEPHGVLYANQWDNTANRQAHHETTGPEIWEQTDGKVDGFICAIGTGGTLAGVAMALRERKADVVIGLADPMGAEVDAPFQIHDEEAVTVCFQLLKEEGLCLGGSSGINVAGAARLARQLGPGHTIVTVLCDYGTRYSSKLYNPEFLREKGLPVPDWLV